VLAAPWSARIIRAVKKTGVPVIHFVYDGGGVLEKVRDTGSDVVGLDWRVDIDVARKRLGTKVAVQGNLDPCSLFLPERELRARVREVLGRTPGSRAHLQPRPRHPAAVLRPRRAGPGGRGPQVQAGRRIIGLRRRCLTIAAWERSDGVRRDFRAAVGRQAASSLLPVDRLSRSLRAAQSALMT
jgi:hypothetical protein